MKKLNGKIFQSIAIVLILGACISCGCGEPLGEKKPKSVLPDTCNGTNFMKLGYGSQVKSYLSYWLNGSSIYSIRSYYENQLVKINSSNSSCIFEYTNISLSHDIYKLAVLPNKNMWILTRYSNTFSLVLIDTMGNVQLTSNIQKYISSAHIGATSDNGCIVILINSIDKDSINNISNHTYKNAILRFDAYGKIVWQHDYSGCTPQGIIESSSKDIFVFGSSLLKYDKNGKQLWTKNYKCNSMIELPSNTFLISNYKFFKINNDGVILWEKSIPNNNDIRLQNSDDGDFIICYTEYKNHNDNIYLEKYNTEGQNVWKKSFGGTGQETLFSVFYIPLKGYYILGTSENYTGVSSILEGETERCSEKWQNYSFVSSYFIKTDLNGNTCN